MLAIKENMKKDMKACINFVISEQENKCEIEIVKIMSIL